MPGKSRISIALVDDHTLFRKGLISLIEMLGDRFVILFEADDGVDMQHKLNPAQIPDIILMDINMPGMDGFATVQWLNKHYPDIKVLVVSMVDKEESIIKMLKLGVKGYLSKDVEPVELNNALEAIYSKGFYYTDFITGTLVHTLQNGEENSIDGVKIKMNDKELNFLQFVCSELTYHQIASQMFLSPKTVDGYRNNLFEKLNVKSRVGLALFAVKHGYVKL